MVSGPVIRNHGEILLDPGEERSSALDVAEKP